MRKTLLIISCISGFLHIEAQHTFFKCDFSEGFPEGVALFDIDRNEPSIDMKNFGFDIGVPWIVAEEDGGNLSACSTSWYKTPGRSNDWMVTPAIEISSSSALLRWRGRSGDSEYKDGYSVYISETGNSVEDFDITQAVFSTKSEKAQWTAHEISLREYEGKTIHIAFVNDSEDKAALYIDDITVGVPSCLEVESTISRVISKPGPLTVSGNVYNTSDKEINGFTVKYSFGEGDTYTHQINKTIKPGANNSFRIDSPISISKNETLDYTIQVECDGDEAADSGKVSAYTRRIVAEEVTGVWCGYCIRGIVAMREMKEFYGDSFLGIAVHAGSQTWPDPMEMPEYTDWLFNKFNMSGYPHATVNRTLSTTGDPGNIYSYYTRLSAEENYCGLSLNADINKETRILSATTTLFSAKDLTDTNLRLAYVLIENEVHGDNSMEYAQSNYYAGGEMGEMGGFEDMPSIIPGDLMYFQDVARYFSPGFGGIEGSVPTNITEGVGVTHEHHFELPQNILNDENTELAVLLINGKTDAIINAESIPLKDLFKESSVETMSQCDRLSIRRDGSLWTVKHHEPIKRIDVISADGRLLFSQETHGTSADFEILCPKGIFLIRAILENGSQIITKSTN